MASPHPGVGRLAAPNRSRDAATEAKIAMEMSDELGPRRLGLSSIRLSPLGLGCWAIGGPTVGDDGRVTGWGDVDDDELIRAIQRGFDLGVTFFDTADTYGAGHSERLLARALGLHNEEVVIATKFGWTFDDDGSRRSHGMDVSPAYIRSACQASLRRLQRDDIDLYQLHVGSLPDAQADEVVETLEASPVRGSDPRVRLELRRCRAGRGAGPIESPARLCSSSATCSRRPPG